MPLVPACAVSCLSRCRRPGQSCEQSRDAHKRRYTQKPNGTLAVTFLDWYLSGIREWLAEPRFYSPRRGMNDHHAHSYHTENPGESSRVLLYLEASSHGLPKTRMVGMKVEKISISPKSARSDQSHEKTTSASAERFPSGGLLSSSIPHSSIPES